MFFMWQPQMLSHETGLAFRYLSRRNQTRLSATMRVANSQKYCFSLRACKLRTHFS